MVLNSTPSSERSSSKNALLCSEAVCQVRQSAVLLHARPVKAISSTGSTDEQPLRNGGMHPGPLYVPAPAFHQVLLHCITALELPAAPLAEMIWAPAKIYIEPMQSSSSFPGAV